MTKSLDLKHLLNSLYAPTLWLTLLSFIAMLMINVLLFYKEGVSPILDFVNYETASQKEMIKGNQIDRYINTYSSILKSKSFFSIYSIYSGFNYSKIDSRNKFIPTESVLVQENNYIWFKSFLGKKFTDYRLGFNWSVKNPLNINISIKKKTELNSLPDIPSKIWYFYVAKRYDFMLNILMLIPDIFILFLGFFYHRKIKKRHKNVINQFTEAESLFDYDQDAFESDISLSHKFIKSDFIIAEFLSLREKAIRNGKKYFESKKKLIDLENKNQQELIRRLAEEKFLAEQRQIFINHTKATHDFYRTIKLCSTKALNKINSGELYTEDEIKDLRKNLMFCEKILADSKDLSTPLTGRNMDYTISDLVEFLELEENKLLIEKKNCSVTLNLDRNLVFDLDRGFHRVFSNIISNAIEKMCDNKAIYISHEFDEEFIKFIFRNSGSFLEKNKVNYINSILSLSGSMSFTKERGNGLLIANEIVKAHNGKITINSFKELNEEWFEVFVVLPKKVIM
jgi:hypothetical protein